MKTYPIRWLLNADPPKDKPLKAQIEALERSYPKEGWGHFLDMGLGKTTTALNEFCMGVEDGGLTRMLVVAPNNFKPDWAVEAADFRFPYRMVVLESDQREKAIKEIKTAKAKGEVLAMVVNYEALSYKKTMEVIDLFTAGERVYFAIDESIKIKNPNSGFFNNSMRVASKAVMKRLLTGKPVVQGPQDLWSQLRLIGAMDGMSYFSFRNRYCLMGGFKGREVVGYKNEKELNDYLVKWSFTANIRDYSDRPLPAYVLRNVPMSSEQLALYKKMEQEFMIDLGNGKVASAAMVITRYMKLQQITSGFLYDDDGNTHWLVEPKDNNRLIETRRILDEEIQGKLIIGAHHSSVIDMLLEQLKDYGAVALRGLSHSSREEQKEAKNSFNKNPACRVIIGQLDATKYGHTLLGDQDVMPCHHTLFYENVFSLDTRSQFERRNDRTGQRNGVINIDFHSSPFDLRVVTALQRKEDISSAIIGYVREKGILTGKLP